MLPGQSTTVAGVEPLELAALLWAIDKQPTDQLPDVATDALVRGLDSPALRELAGAPTTDYWQVKYLFENALSELGIDVPDEQAALWRLAQNKAAEIVSGEVAPADGAHWIWSEVSDRIRREGDLRVFIGLASEWDDHPNERAEIERSIIDAARGLQGQKQPRRWLRIQARHGSAPVTDSGTRVELRPRDLPISGALVGALSTWADEYDATFEAGRDGFGSQTDAETFVRQGRELVERLQIELGSRYHVEYIPEPTKSPGLRLRGNQ